MELDETPVTDLLEALQSGDVSALAVTESVLDALDEHRDLGAFVATTDPDDLRERARRADRRREEDDDLGPLAGLPVAVKDNICTTELPTTAGSRMLEDYEPPYAATVVRSLRDAGALVVGKTNLDEFGMGSSTETSHVGPTRHPDFPERSPGGSSGGSAAAVAAGCCPAALGSDTGGSLRQPAAHCGIVGVKPTYGRVSRHGLVAYASSLEQIGPMAPTVDGAARLLDTLAGHDPRDANSVDRRVPAYAAAGPADPADLRVGVPRHLESTDAALDPEVDDAFRRTIDRLEEAGADVEEVALPHVEYAVAAYYVIATAEASSNLARYDGVRFGRRAEADSYEELVEASRTEGFGDQVQRRIVLGTWVLSEGYYEDYYRKAQKVRTLVGRDYDEAFETVDVVATPTAPTPAFPLGDKLDDPLELYMQDVFTTPANLAGLPAMSQPCGTADDGRPIGLQLVAPAFDESTLFAAGRLVEELR